jgi:hypothetical protein
LLSLVLGLPVGQPLLHKGNHLAVDPLDFLWLVLGVLETVLRRVSADHHAAGPRCPAYLVPVVHAALDLEERPQPRVIAVARVPAMRRRGLPRVDRAVDERKPVRGNPEVAERVHRSHVRERGHDVVRARRERGAADLRLVRERVQPRDERGRVRGRRDEEVAPLRADLVDPEAPRLLERGLLELDWVVRPEALWNGSVKQDDMAEGLADEPLQQSCHIPRRHSVQFGSEQIGR